MLWVLFSDLGKCRTREGFAARSTALSMAGGPSSDQTTTSLSLSILHKVEIIMPI